MIRAVTSADLPAIAALHLTSWQDTYADLMPRGFLEDEAPRYLAEKWSRFPAGNLLVAEHGGVVQGFILIDAAAPAYVDALHVAATARGQRLGEALLRAAFATAAARGTTAAWLYIIEGNEGALRFYQRLGAVETWRGPDPDHGAGIIAIRLDWPDFSIMLPPTDPN